MSRRSFGLMVSLIIGVNGQGAGAGFLTLSPTGATGPGGSITFAEIGPYDNTYANVNTDDTATGAIPVTFTVSDNSPVSLYGSDVDDSRATWTNYTARIVSGLATFQDPNDPYGSYSTYTDTPGWSVTLADSGTEAIFSGGSIAPGDSLDTFLGLIVSDPSRPVTIDLEPDSVPGPPSLILSAVAGAILWSGRAARRGRPWRAVAMLFVITTMAAGNARAGGPQVVTAYQSNFTIAAVGTVPGSPTQMAIGPDGSMYVMTVDAGPIRFAVAVDVTSGKVRQVATGFNGPLAVYADDNSGRLLVANYGDRVVYSLQANP